MCHPGRPRGQIVIFQPVGSLGSTAVDNTPKKFNPPSEELYFIHLVILRKMVLMAWFQIPGCHFLKPSLRCWCTPSGLLASCRLSGQWNWLIIILYWITWLNKSGFESKHSETWVLSSDSLIWTHACEWSSFPLEKCVKAYMWSQWDPTSGSSPLGKYKRPSKFKLHISAF